MKNVLLLLITILCFWSCKTADLCESITCENGGLCDNGKCRCDRLWQGDNCEIQVTPSQVVINTFIINQVPATDATGEAWDFTSGPDLYLIAKINGVVVMNTRDDYWPNTLNGANWLNKGISLSPSATLILSVYDYDSPDADDYIGGIQGPVYSSTGGFPDSFVMTCASCTVSITLGTIVYL